MKFSSEWRSTEVELKVAGPEAPFLSFAVHINLAERLGPPQLLQVVITFLSPFGCHNLEW